MILRLLSLLSGACFFASDSDSRGSPWYEAIEAGHRAYNEGRYAEAEKEYQAALEEAKQFKQDDARLPLTLNDLGEACRVQGKFEQAEHLFVDALALSEQHSGGDNLNVAQILNNLAAVYAAQGRFDEAVPLYRHAIEVEENSLGREHPVVATSLNNLALVHRMQGEYAEALPLLTRALRIGIASTGQEHPHVGTAFNNLASVCFGAGRTREAEVFFRQALAIKQQTLGIFHPEVAVILENLGELTLRQGRKEDAENLFRRSRAIEACLHGAEPETEELAREALAGALANVEIEDLSETLKTVSQSMLGPREERPGIRFGKREGFEEVLADIAAAEETNSVDHARSEPGETSFEENPEIAVQPQELDEQVEDREPGHGATETADVVEAPDQSGTGSELPAISDSEEPRTPVGPAEFHVVAPSALPEADDLPPDLGALAEAATPPSVESASLESEPFTAEANRVDVSEVLLASHPSGSIPLDGVSLVGTSSPLSEALALPGAEANLTTAQASREGETRSFEVEEPSQPPLEVDLSAVLNGREETSASAGLLASGTGEPEESATGIIDDGGLEAELRSWVETREADLGDQHPELIPKLNQLALICSLEGRLRDAEQVYRHILDIKEKQFGKQHASLVTSLDRLAEILFEQAQYADAELCWKRIQEIDESRFGAEHPALAVDLGKLAESAQAQGNLEEARDCYQRALGIWQESGGPEHPELARTLEKLALLDRKRGNREQAAARLQQALAIAEKVYGEGHPALASALNSLAALYSEDRKPAEAEALLRLAVEIQEGALGPDHLNLAHTLNNLAALHASQGQYREAEPLFLRALGIKKEAWGGHHPGLANTFENLAILYESQQRNDLAEQFFLQALEELERGLGREHRNLVPSLGHYASFLRKTGRGDEARRIEKRARTIRKREEANLAADGI